MMFSGNPARLLGKDHMNDGVAGTGSIEVARSADLIVAELERDLTTKFRIEKVFLKGEIC
jgi:imidazolonepropionase-like amidohydrolase